MQAKIQVVGASCSLFNPVAGKMPALHNCKKKELAFSADMHSSLN